MKLCNIYLSRQAKMVTMRTSSSLESDHTEFTFESINPDPPKRVIILRLKEAGRGCQQLERGCEDQIAQGVPQCRNASEVHQASKTTLKKLGRCLAANTCTSQLTTIGLINQT